MSNVSNALRSPVPQPLSRAPSAVLALRDVAIEFANAAGAREVVRAVSFDMPPGSVTALVGESGSGKTLIARSILRLLPPGARLTGGAMNFEDSDLRALSEAELQRVRGRRIAMVFQEPLTSLNPAMRIGAQLAEGLKFHLGISDGEARSRCIAMLDRVRMRDPTASLDRYPHQLSGGMRQRVMLASAMLLKPALLIADEPTTALDPITQHQVLELMLELARESNTAVLLISHDLSVVARYAKRIVVLREGSVVEQGETQQILRSPQEPYTRMLLAATQSATPAQQASTQKNESKPLVQATGLGVEYPSHRRLFRRRAAHPAVSDVDLSIEPNETLALVGESGSGKSTLGRVLLGLLPATTGIVQFEGTALRAASAHARIRQRMQIVFQDPYSSLDPRMRIEDIVAEPLRFVSGVSREQRRTRSMEMLAEVGIPAQLAGRFPHQLSGGQRQRVGIARALVGRPDFVVADEAVSALDVTIRAQILELLKALQTRHRFAMLFITHDLAAVERIADRVAVMHRGSIVELGSAGAVLDTPAHPYTRALLEASPKLTQSSDGNGYTVSLREFAPQALPEGYECPWPHENGVGVSDERNCFIAIGAGHFVRCVNAAN